MTLLTLAIIWIVGIFVASYVIYFIRCRKYVKLKKAGYFEYTELTVDQYIEKYYDEVPDFLIVLIWPFSLIIAIINLLYEMVNKSNNLIKLLVRKVTGIETNKKLD